MNRVPAMLALLATLPAFAASDGHREWHFNVALVAGTHVENFGCVMSSACRNPAILTQMKLLTAWTGEYDNVRVELLGDETIAERKVPVQARRYALHAPKLRIDVWYAAGGNRVQLESLTRSGRKLHYSLQ